MSKNFTYLRINKNNKKYTKDQEDGIINYVKKHNIEIFHNIEVEINTPSEEKNILELLKSCKMNSTLIVYDLNVFGRTIETILEIVKFLLENKVRILVIKQNLELVDNDDMLTKMVLGMISMTIALEKDLMSLRTKEALTAKKLNGQSLGKPKGTIQKSKFDKQRDKIEELLSVGLSVRKIAKLLGYNNHIGLNNYVKKRNIREHSTSLEELAS
ncbi:Resolvase domain protein [Arcobacter nitrofigilis DSM 7299]|uniref:Resolvase domain protein n=1 Tax=Arcobacter nitrofigilis (strain ATCC 33309 / DSM 7299 / CCUG 15893 / LMG 7604 / NCTC 12251 / CI) TaxID=572480 RepID=D5V005_ARCNC|nr:recombinase family protein [Arcobacter nitrofigilis]ADG93617.1 Resolvase domain protein [Arcobacter nitrofigilis DSM 7299]